MLVLVGVLSEVFTKFFCPYGKNEEVNGDKEGESAITCQTKAIAKVFKETSQEKKDIVEEMGFGALAHVLEMNVSHNLLRELIDFYDYYHGCLKTLHEKIYITSDKIAAALGINHSENHFPKKVDYGKLNPADKQIIDSFKCIMLASLTKSILEMSVEREENRQKF
ncbi:hypothetical protein Ahy_B01g056522 [Arachis hypogaea]|uniref:Uncharacterized protein n=1 Tax=Arachis hypogaea TaxID=3818 RepID=A0A445AZ05_ARAHY|nr:hypothetical protein Ahy_B01g056522 [Arachis hypogaea]